jgi:MFS family permease
VSQQPISEVKAVSSLALLYMFRMLGLFMVLPVLMLYGDAYSGSSPFLLGLALGIYGLTQACLQVPLGLLSDVWGRKPVIALGLVVFAAGSAVAASSDSMTGLIIGRALQGAGAIASAIMALVADLTSEANRTKAMAAIGVSIGVSFALALILGPFIAGLGGISAVFWVSAVLAGVGLLIVWRIVPAPLPAAFGAASGDTGTVPGLIGATLRHRELLRLDWGIFCLHFVLMASFVAVPGMLESFNFDPASHWKVYLPLMMLAFLAMLPFIAVAERKQQTKPVFLGAVALLAVAQVALAQWHAHFALGLTLLFAYFVAFNLLEATLPSLVSKLAPAGAKGTAMGIYSTSQFLGAFAGGAAGGLVLQYWGLTGVFAICGGVALVWWLVSVPMRVPPPVRAPKPAPR